MKKMREEVSWLALNGVRLWAGGRPGVLPCGSPCRGHLPAAAGPFSLTCTPLCLGVCFGGLRGVQCGSCPHSEGQHWRGPHCLVWRLARGCQDLENPARYCPRL